MIKKLKKGKDRKSHYNNGVTIILQYIWMKNKFEDYFYQTYKKQLIITSYELWLIEKWVLIIILESFWCHLGHRDIFFCLNYFLLIKSLFNNYLLIKSFIVFKLLYQINWKCLILQNTYFYLKRTIAHVIYWTHCKHR